jgi:hypothetical protein
MVKRCGKPIEDFDPEHTQQNRLLQILQYQNNRPLMGYYNIPDLAKKRVFDPYTAPPTINYGKYKAMMQHSLELSNLKYLFGALIHDLNYKGEFAYSEKVMQGYIAILTFYLNEDPHGERVLDFTRRVYHGYFRYYNDQLGIDWTRDAEVYLFFIALYDLLFSYNIKRPLTEKWMEDHVFLKCASELDDVAVSATELYGTIHVDLAALTN